MNAPTIETEHLILRGFRPEDADAYYEAVLSDPVTTRALPTGRPTPPQRARSIIENHIDHWQEYGYGLWAVIHRDDDALIGHCGLQRLGETANVELTYAMRRPHVTGDLPIEAGYACLRYGFETLRLPQVMGVLLPGNEAARRVYISLEMHTGPTVYAYGNRLPTFVITQGNFRLEESHYVVRGASDDPSPD